MSKEEAMIAYVDEMKKVCLLIQGFSRTNVPEIEECEVGSCCLLLPKLQMSYPLCELLHFSTMLFGLWGEDNYQVPSKATEFVLFSEKHERSS